MEPGTDMDNAPLERVSPVREALKEALKSALLSGGVSAAGTALLNKRIGKNTGIAAAAGGGIGAVLGGLGGYEDAKQDNRLVDMRDGIRSDPEEETDPQMKTAAVDGFMVGYMQKRSEFGLPKTHR